MRRQRRHRLRERRHGARRQAARRAAGWRALGWGAAALGGYAAALALLRPWHTRWGATDEERDLPLPGDELMHHATAHHAITIDAPVDEVWRWLVQIGQDRAGFYSDTWLENLVRADMPDAERVNPEWQALTPGDHVRLASRAVYGDRPRVRVAAAEPGRHLVLEGWGAFVLRPIDERTTRVLVRSHAKRTGPLARAYRFLLFEPAHFAMERAMLRGLKRRAEHAAREAQEARE